VVLGGVKLPWRRKEDSAIMQAEAEGSKAV